MVWYSPKSWFSKPKQTGTVFLKPSESVKVPKGVTVSVPSTGQSTVSTGKKVTATPSRSSGGGGRVSGAVPAGTTAAEKKAFRETGTPVPTKVTPPSVTTTPSATTIQSQIKSIDLPPTDTGEFVKLGFGEALIASGKKFGQRFGSPTSERPDDILSPFDLTKKPGFSKEAFVTDTGSIRSAERLTERQKRLLEESGTEVTTLGELRKVADVKVKERGDIVAGEQRGILEGRRQAFQQKIDTGELSLEEAQQGFSSDVSGANVIFQQAQQDIFKTEVSSKGLTNLGARDRSGVRALVDLGLFSNPLTSFVAAASSSKSDLLKK